MCSGIFFIKRVVILCIVYTGPVRYSRLYERWELRFLPQAASSRENWHKRRGQRRGEWGGGKQVILLLILLLFQWVAGNHGNFSWLEVGENSEDKIKTKLTPLSALLMSLKKQTQNCKKKNPFYLACIYYWEGGRGMAAAATANTIPPLSPTQAIIMYRQFIQEMYTL